jgi:uncharacterized membrane-anchored protein YitT (DUF2179 family)
VLAFGLYNIHALANVTEGGVLGLILLLEHWLHISPALSGFVLNAACYGFGWRTLGRNFIFYSALSSAAFPSPMHCASSSRPCGRSYTICRCWPPFWARCLLA